ncbi:MauE/DoxX family redox-associated membrane protein [Adhaeribacter terreus]|uniref:MauE/DoxX family redox-associated membrane protein n=1 Tax=Adhaeribacter terreus TaxID=529703 RepID=A0ABW0EE23_9BACT
MISEQKTAIPAIILSAILGLIFLLSAYTKLYPIEPFEYTFVEFGITNWQFSGFVARLFIGFEFACGVLLLFNLWLKRFTIPLVALVLVLFNIYLLIQIFKFGNQGNCGCFGEFFKFTPLEGILKNVAMLVAAAFIYRYHRGFVFRKIKLVTGALVIVSLALPFILNPVDLQVSENNYSGKLHYKLPLELLYEDATNEPPKVALREGKWIIAYFSLTCPHCKIAAKKLHVMKQQNPGLPVHMILNGDDENLQPFFDNTRASDISWSMFTGADKFMKMAGASLPQIFWVNNSVVENKSSYFTLNQTKIEAWLKKP